MVFKLCNMLPENLKTILPAIVEADQKKVQIVKFISSIKVEL